MDFFSFGNLLAIGLSVGIFVLYRFIDRDNRSLEKVRRYVQTAQKELDAFLAERMQSLKDFSIEFQVHETTGKQLIQRVKTAEEELMARAESIDELRSKLDHLTQSVTDLEQMSVKVDENLNRLKEESEFVDKVGRRIKAAVEQMRSLEAEIPNLVQQFGQRNQQDLEQILEKLRGLAAEETRKIEGASEAAQTRMAEFQKFLQALEAKKQAYVQEAQKNLQEVYTKAHEKAVADVKALEKEWQVHEKAYHDRLNKLYEQASGGVKKLEQDWAEKEKSFSLTLKQHASAVSKLADDVFGKAVTEAQHKSQEAHNLILDQFARVEKVFREFEENFKYKIGQLDSVGKDLDALDNNLRGQMTQQKDKILAEIDNQSKLLQEELARYRSSHHQQVQELSNSMKHVEEELDALKARAYDNVSEKLKIFEDEFFKDLQKRDVAMTSSFEELQQKINDKVLEVDQEVARSLEASARRWQDRLKEEISALQGAANEQINKVESGLGTWREKMEASWSLVYNNTEDRLKQFGEDLAKTAQDWQKRIDNETARRELALKEGLSQVERELEAKTKTIKELSESHRSEIIAKMETTKSDLVLWQNRLSTQFKEMESEQLEQYQSFKQFIQEKINGLKEEFTRQRDDLVFATQEERANLKRELKELKDDLDSLTQNLHNRTASALEESKKEYDIFLMDFQRKMREFQAEQDAVVKDFKASVNDNKEKAEAMQKKLFGKIEDHYNLLQVNLEEIDKRLKNFVAQTKLFERADSLRAELGEAIEDLKTQIEKVGLQRKDLFELENQMARIRKIHDENNERLNRFLAEKKKLEAMDSDFQKVVNLSQSMELRLQQVTNSHDTLQQIQFEIRKLEEYAKEMDAQMERLERRRQIVDSTTESVDRNFNLITQIERQIKDMQGTVGSLPAQVEEIQRRMRTLIQSKGETEAAIQLANKLDGILTDLESRASKLDKAREWLAATETRLLEISKQSEEQLKILAAINKSDKSKSGGAPANDIRQVVLKLAHQGWNKGEIARVTKLSVGEVELILEMETSN